MRLRLPSLLNCAGDGLGGGAVTGLKKANLSLLALGAGWGHTSCQGAGVGWGGGREMPACKSRLGLRTWPALKVFSKGLLLGVPCWPRG